MATNMLFKKHTARLSAAASAIKTSQIQILAAALSSATLCKLFTRMCLRQQAVLIWYNGAS